MNKIGLIIKREYLRRVSKKSFLLLTFLTPFLFAALVFVPLWLSTIKGDDVKQVAISDTTGKYAPLFKDTEEYTFITEKGSSLEEYRKNPDKEIFAFLNITDDLLQNPTAATLYSQKQIPMGLKNTIDKTLSEYLKDEKLASYNIDNLKQIIEDSKINFNIKTIKWDEDGSEKSTSAEVASILGMILTFIIYMFIIMYGGMVMQGVMEEKTNRIIEVMISSVKPFDLMMGKIIGIGFVGLTQVFLWGILTTVLVSGSLFFFGGNTSPEDMMTAQMTAQGINDVAAGSSDISIQVQEIINSINFGMIGTCFVLYFIGGYLLYAALFAAIGSALEQQEDTQQFMTPIMLLMAFSLYAGIYSMNNPDGPLAFWCSMIPFTSPIVMMVRLPFDIPVWELALSFALLFYRMQRLMARATFSSSSCPMNPNFASCSSAKQTVSSEVWSGSPKPAVWTPKCSTLRYGRTKISCRVPVTPCISTRKMRCEVKTAWSRTVLYAPTMVSPSSKSACTFLQISFSLMRMRFCMGLSRNSIVLSPFSVVVGSIVAPPAGFDKRHGTPFYL